MKVFQLWSHPTHVRNGSGQWLVLVSGWSMTNMETVDLIIFSLEGIPNELSLHYIVAFSCLEDISAFLFDLIGRLLVGKTCCSGNQMLFSVFMEWLANVALVLPPPPHSLSLFKWSLSYHSHSSFEREWTRSQGKEKPYLRLSFPPSLFLSSSLYMRQCLLFSFYSAAFEWNQ